MIDIRQTIQYANYLRQISWITERKNGINYFIKKIPILGSVIKIQRPKKIIFEDIEKLRKKYKAFQIIIEPNLDSHIGSVAYNLLSAEGFKISKSPFLPSKTLQLGLTPKKEKIFAGFKKDCKQAINKNKNLKTKIYGENELKEFRNIWKNAVGFKRYVPPLKHLEVLKKSFKGNSFFITDEGKNSGAIFLTAKDIAFYWQAFTNKKARKNQVQYKIVWEGILWAKDKGARVFDFEGIYDPRFPNKSWLGFTHFKKSFGGYEVESPGCYTKLNFLEFK